MKLEERRISSQRQHEILTCESPSVPCCNFYVRSLAKTGFPLLSFSATPMVPVKRQTNRSASDVTALPTVWTFRAHMSTAPGAAARACRHERSRHRVAAALHDRQQNAAARCLAYGVRRTAGAAGCERVDRRRAGHDALRSRRGDHRGSTDRRGCGARLPARDGAADRRWLPLGLGSVDLRAGRPRPHCVLVEAAAGVQSHARTATPADRVPPRTRGTVPDTRKNDAPDR